jgi:hypothetical protein
MYERIALLFMILAMLHGRPFFASPNLCKGANKINKKREGDAWRHDPVPISRSQSFKV